MSDSAERRSTRSMSKKLEDTKQVPGSHFSKIDDHVSCLDSVRNTFMPSSNSHPSDQEATVVKHDTIIRHDELGSDKVDRFDCGSHAVLNPLKSKRIDKDNVSIHDTESCSSRSSKRRSSKAVLLLAQLREKQLVEQLERQRQLRAFKDDCMIMDARAEVDYAKLEADLSDDSESEEPVAPPLRPCKQEDMNRYLLDCKENLACNQGMPQMTEGRQGPDTAHYVVDKVSTRVFDLPKMSLPSFDGNVRDYWAFIKQFDLVVEGGTRDPSQRLLYLLSHCVGPAKEAINNCLIQPPDIGYREARSILRDAFGQPHQISSCMVADILAFPRVASSDSDALFRLSVKMNSCLIALQEMNYMDDLNSLNTIERIVLKLPSEIREKWGRIAEVTETENHSPKFCELVDLVRKEAKYGKSKFGRLARTNAFQPDRPPMAPPRHPMTGKTITHRLVNLTLKGRPDRSKDACPNCSKEHMLDMCSPYLAMQISDRWNLVKRKGCCYCCLKHGHRVIHCPTLQPCGINGCVRRHHKSLHANLSSEPLPETHAICNNTRVRSCEVALGVVPVRVSGPLGVIVVYALLDNGSNTSLILQSILDQVGITGCTTHLTMQTLSSTASMPSERCSFTVESLDSGERITIEEAYSVARLPRNLHAYPAKEAASKWPHLADLTFPEATDKEIGLLIGCDTPEAHWPLQQRLGSRKQPFAIRTLLGWVLFGPYRTGTGQNVIQTTTAEETPIWEFIQNMYDKDFRDMSDTHECLSVDERLATEIVRQGLRHDGLRFTVPLPWKPGQDIMPNNFACAIRRLNALKHRFRNDDNLRTQYHAIIAQHLQKGYVELVPEPNVAKGDKVWYLPHHPVFHPKKPGKVRIVFDCAAKHQGLSLNDRLFQGPDTTSNLSGILMRFRRFPVALAADIEEMFLQVRVADADKDALRFLWWSNQNLEERPDCFRITVHPFGATSSPFCANFAMKQAMLQFGANMSEEAQGAVRRDFYVDDCITSTPTVESAKIITAEITHALRQGGFRLRKWISNRREALVNVRADDLAEGVLQLKDYKLPTERTLGVEWNAESDEFIYRFNCDETATTRRGILGCVSSIFDPLGLVSPLVLPARSILQDLCRRGLGWDEPIPEPDRDLWTHWKSSILSASGLTVPRRITELQPHDVTEYQLHLFADASERGYGAAAYVRCIGTHQFNSRLLIAKSRVAPLKTVSIPRLELSAAVLATRLYKHIIKEGGMSYCRVFFWTDSIIVLRYLANTSARFCTFVANRIQEIREGTTPHLWRHVDSKNNPADLASRGMCWTHNEASLWLLGPAFLQTSEDLWPLPITVNTDLLGLELKKCATVNQTVASSPTMDSIIHHYSCWHKMRRALAWWKRFAKYLRVMAGNTTVSIRVGPLKLDEIMDSELIILRHVQRSCFSDTIECLTRDESTPTRYKLNGLHRLTPVIRDSLICVGGRLQLTDWNERSKYPVILPKNHHVTAAVVSYYHTIEGHSGVSHVLACIRRKYWVVQGGAVVRRILNKCLICRRNNANPASQKMAPLPTPRIEQGWFPFQHVGVDYFGPLTVKRGRSHEKRYGCLFTCLQCRAIHLELASSLSTDSFIMALMRFVNRRGAPTDIYSDNGTNFVGAARELRQWMTGLQQASIVSKLNACNVNWHFNPPAASHRGGVWERLIRSVRKILMSTTHNHCIDEESLVTYLSHAERIINDRPLTAIMDDVRDPAPLRPNDLLQPRSTTVILLDCPLEQLAQKRWRIVNNLTASFWKRWRLEYLSALQARQQWLKPRREFQIGDIVTIVAEGTPKGTWPLGIVSQVHKSQDGLIRTVDVKTSSGMITRDIRKICLLEGIG